MTAQATTEAFFDPETGTVTYVVSDNASGRAAVIDPVLDYDFKSAHTSTVSADRVLAYLQERHLHIDWILETHAHADHLSAAAYIKEQAGGRIAIGEHICEVQRIFKKIYNLEHDFLPDGSQFDHLFRDGETFRIGELEAQALLVPGHTPADMAYVVERKVFVGDTLFMPDVGTARADFPGGNAHELYRSIRRLLALPDDTVMYVCHDYPPPTRSAQWQTSVAQQRTQNIHVHDGISEIDFVRMRHARDSTLGTPTLILPALQINVRAGNLPSAEENGTRYLKIPLNTLPA